MKLLRSPTRRTLEVNATCPICGQEDEDVNHAVINCTKARALRSEIRKVWKFPSERAFAYAGPNWLQCLLGTCDVRTRDRILLMFWRAWFLCEDCVHVDGKALVSVSVDILHRYEMEIMLALGPEPDDAGKVSLFPALPSGRAHTSNEILRWTPPT